MVDLISLFRLAVLVPCLVLSLAACGTDPTGGEQTVLSLTAVSEATAEERTARTATVWRQTTKGLPDEADQSFEWSVEGVVDLQQSRGRFRLETSNFDSERGERVEGAVDLLVDDQTGYARSTDAEAAGEKWLKLPRGNDLTNLGVTAIDASFASGLGLKVLGLDGPSEVEELGREDLRGTSTLHYRVTVDASEEDVQSAGLSPTFAVSPFVYEVWVDDADRMRRMTFQLDLTASTRAMLERHEGGEEGATTLPPEFSIVATVDIEAWDFGIPVDIELPSPDQVTTEP